MGHGNDYQYSKNLFSPHITSIWQYVYRCLLYDGYCFCVNRSKYNINKKKIYLILMTISDNVLYWPPDKSSRWLAYCQYYMINKGYATVNRKENIQGHYFMMLIRGLSYNIPKTIKI